MATRRQGSVRAVPTLAPPPFTLRPPPPPESTGRPVHDLLEAHELSRTRLFALLGVALPTSGLFLLPFLGGEVRAREVFGASLVVAAIGSAWLLWSLRDSERYDPWRLLGVGTLWLLAELAGLHYVGAFSPLVAVLPLGILFFGMTRDEWLQALAFAAGAGSYLVLALESVHPRRVEYDALGAQSPSGAIVDSASLTPLQSLVMLAVVELSLAIAFIAARSARSATMLALARHERASSAVVQKDAQLSELQKDLAHALDVAGVGRFSDTVVGSYKLGEVLGRGAMGEVYLAHHRDTHEEAAVKLLHTHTMREPGSVQRFLREAKMAAALETRHAVRILEVGGFEGDLPYLAMERLRGEDLAELLRRSPRLNMLEVLRFLAEVGAGLSAAREAGVVHRDVKPRNLFLSEGDKPGERIWKLLDFGVSTFATADVTHGDGRIIGTPEYMAPEQAAGEPVTYRTDLFSLGAVVYRALTGYQAFVGDHIVEVLYQVGHAMPPKPSAVADLAPEIDVVLAVALAKVPTDRFESAEELRHALESAARGEVTTELRERARKILEVFPWGETPTGEE